MVEILRKSSLVVLVLAIIIILFGSIAMFSQSVIAGILYLIVGVLCALFYAGFIFLFLNMAEDVEYIKYKIMEIDRKNNKEKQDEIKDGWKCAECGKVNRSYTTTCSCGKTK